MEASLKTGRAFGLMLHTEVLMLNLITNIAKSYNNYLHTEAGGTTVVGGVDTSKPEPQVMETEVLR